MHAKEHEDVTRGVYHPFSIVLREEGGREDGTAVVAANNYCKKCAAEKRGNGSERAVNLCER